MTGKDDNRDGYIAALAEEKSRLAADLANIRRSNAVFDVARERTRQVNAEGWSEIHDDAHGDGSIALAGACYAMFASISDEARAATDMPTELTTDGQPIAGWAAWLSIWPWERHFWKPTARRRDLVKASALLIAEIERIDRAAATATTGTTPTDGGENGA